MPAELRPLLEVAAVIGRDFDLVGVAAAAALPLDAVVDLLGSAVSAGLVVPIAEKVGWWSFVHALVKETIYDDVAVGRRMRLHHEIGQRLDALDLSDRVDEVVYHFARAVPLGDSGRLMTLAVAAGERSLDRLAYEQAADHFQLALSLHDASPSGLSRQQLLLALGNAYARSGNSGAAVRAFSAAATTVADGSWRSVRRCLPRSCGICRECSPRRYRPGEDARRSGDIRSKGGLVAPRAPARSVGDGALLVT